MDEVKQLTSPDEGNSIVKFFEGRHVFVTGGTGFMGKVLVEKILRSCPGVGKIYLLTREKRGKTTAVRHREYVEHMIFNRLREERPGFVAQLHPMSGDSMSEGLGLSAADRGLLLANVEIVFHCAASVRFDQPLRDTVFMNTRGTLRVLQLAEHMVKLQSFVHVSTSFCHCHLDVLEEKAYPALADPLKVIDILEWMDVQTLETITPQLIGQLPNTYSYSKNLAEQIVVEFAKKFPIGIARPSIVTSALREPVPGWIETLNGPAGLLVGAGKGVLRSMLCNADYDADFMPVDIAINSIIGLAWQVAKKRPATPLVVNVCLPKDVHMTWGEIVEFGRVHLHNYPFSKCLWYPNGSIKSSRLAHNFAVVFFHFLPAYIIDGLLKLCRQKTFLVNVQRRIQTGQKMLFYYTTKKWDFRTENTQAMMDEMNPQDRETFSTNASQVDWNEYIKDYVIGTRRYCLKEDPSTLPKARKLNRRLKLLDDATTFLFYLCVMWFCFTWAGTLAGFVDTAVVGLSSVVGNIPILRVMAETGGSSEMPTTT